jgi:hypothetical protein
MRTNCLLWAWALYWRRHRKGKHGYVALRRSRWGPFPHALYVERRPSGTWRVVSYVPHDPRHKTVPPPVFKGRSRWGDL